MSRPDPEPCVSVLLPVHNGAATLGAALSSLLAQTFTDFEILVLDDGSTDGSAEVARGMNDSRIVIIGDGRRAGLAARLNQGVAAARGRYIARMDADDIAFPDRFAAQVAFLDAHADIDLVGTRAVAFRSDGSMIGLLPFAADHDGLCAQVWRGIPLPHPTWMGRAGWFRANPYATPEVRRAEDQDLLLRAHGHSRYACLDQVLLAYRQDGFALAKTWVARRHLLAAQIRFLAGAGAWGQVARAVGLTTVKVAVDVAAALPGLKSLFFRRMAGAVPDAVADTLAGWGIGPKVARRPKLLMFLSEDWFFCSHFIERAVAARDDGWDVVVLTHFNQSAGAIAARGIRPVGLGFDRRGLNPLAELGTVLDVWRVMRRERPDVVHNVALKPVLYGTLAALAAGIRAIVNAPVGMGYIFTSADRAARLLRLPVTLALRLLLDPGRGPVIFENPDDMDALVGQGMVRRQAAVLIPGAGVDLDLFPQRPEPDGPPRVVLTARMLWDKGVGEFVEAARALKARGVNARFLLVGTSDPLNRAAIPEERLRAWAGEGVVEWLGFRRDIPALLADAAIVCLPSYREGLPKSLLEGLAAGRPIVTTDVPGCRSLVRPGENGLLVPARDAAALTEALARLLGDPATRAAMGRASRAWAEEFSQARINQATLRVYRGFLAGRD